MSMSGRDENLNLIEFKKDSNFHSKLLTAANRKATCAKKSIKCRDAANQRKFIQVFEEHTSADDSRASSICIISFWSKLMNVKVKAINYLYVNLLSKQISTMIDGRCKNIPFVYFCQLLEAALERRFTRIEKREDFSHFFWRCWIRSHDILSEGT